jgi:hypothetical protein
VHSLDGSADALTTRKLDAYATAISSHLVLSPAMLMAAAAAQEATEESKETLASSHLQNVIRSNKATAK